MFVWPGNACAGAEPGARLTTGTPGVPLGAELRNHVRGTRLASPSPPPASAPPEDRSVTTTDVAILLIVLCIVLWAIMAALHRHTVQLEALKAQLQALLEAQRRDAGAAPPPAPADHDDGRAPPHG